MSVEPIPSVATQLASAGTDLITVATGTRAYLACVSFVNRHTSAVTVTIYLIPSGGSKADSNMYAKAVSIAAGDTIDRLFGSACLTAGVKLHCVPSVDAVVNATPTGVIETL